jgi:hypothetical protein
MTPPPPFNDFGPQSKSLYSKISEKQWIFERIFDILVTEICFVNLKIIMSCLSSSNNSMSIEMLNIVS